MKTNKEIDNKILTLADLKKIKNRQFRLSELTKNIKKIDNEIIKQQELVIKLMQEQIEELENWQEGAKISLENWHKIGEHFIKKGLMVWGDILPLKALDIVEKMEKENCKFRFQLNSIPDICPICNKGMVKDE